MKNFIRFINWTKRNGQLILMWVICLFVFLIFENRISNFISQNSIITSTELNNRFFSLVFFTSFIFIAFVFLYSVFKNYRNSKIFNFWISLISTAYLVLRCNNSDNLVFVNFSKTFELGIYYADILLFLGLLTALLYVRNQFFDDYEFYDKLRHKLNSILTQKSDNISDTDYQEDLPQNGNNPNVYDKIAFELINNLDGLKPNKSFIIGIIAEWGLGKTSFLYRIEYLLRNPNKHKDKFPIIFWYNAWQHQDEKSIINNFFNELKEKLSFYSGDAKGSINRYLNRLFAISNNSFIQEAKHFIDEYFIETSSIKNEYLNINNLISKIDRKIIVLVDDLDRLNSNEINEVLRILRNVANFKNMIFICGVDKEYIISKGKLEPNYLDKIFNLEIHLPKIVHSNLRLYLNKLIKDCKSISNNNKDVIIDEISKIFETDYNSYMLDYKTDVLLSELQEKDIKINDLKIIQLDASLFFDTNRDVKKFFNLLITNLSILENFDDINLHDYLLFQLLLHKFNFLFPYFSDKYLNYWFGEDPVLKYSEILKEELRNRKSLNSIEKLTLHTLLSEMFPSEESDTQVINKINQRRYFPIYLNNNIYNNSFTYSTLIKSLSDLSIEDLIEKQIKGNDNEGFLLEDIKKFLIKKEYIRNSEELLQLVGLIKKDYFFFSKIEILDILLIAESNDKIKLLPLANRNIFNNIQDKFGHFLLELNIHFAVMPNDSSHNNDEFDSTINKNKLTQIKWLNKDYTKDKLINLFKNYLKHNPDLQETYHIMRGLIDKYYFIFEFSYYYAEVSVDFKKYLELNFNEIFLSSKSANNTISIFYNDIKFIARIFADFEVIKKVSDRADYLLNNQDKWHSNQLDKKSFILNGWENFLKFLKKNINKTTNKKEKKKGEDLITLVSFLIENNFNEPNDKELIQHKIILQMRDNNSDSKKN